MARILLAEDQAIVRQGLKMMIEQDDELKVTVEAENGEQALQLYQQHVIDLVIMDNRMPVMTGLEATKFIRRYDPKAKILILTTFADEEYAHEALQHGAVGYLLKDADGEKLVNAIKSALNGGLSLDEQVAAKVVPKLMKNRYSAERYEPTRLTEREASILALVGNGKTNQEIAAELHLSHGTIKNHISQILATLELRDRTQLAIYAIRHNYV